MLLCFYLLNSLEEEFHGLHKACNIKSELNYNRDLEGKKSLMLKSNTVLNIVNFAIH